MLTDSDRGMQRSRKLIATVVVTAGAIAVAGCGGGSSSSSTSSPPVKQSSSNASGGVVTPEGSIGIVGPAGRVTQHRQQFQDRKLPIPRDINKRARGRHGQAVVGENCPNITAMPSDANLGDMNAAVFCLVNAERAANGNLPPLNRNTRLESAAGSMCQRMVTEQFFSHVTPDGKTLVDRIQPTGYIPNSGDWVVGENLAWGSGDLSTPQAIVNGWMNSPGHRANILAPDYKDVGLATCQGAPSTQFSGGTTYVNDFGARSGADLALALPPETGTGTTSTANGQQATAAAKQRARAAARRKARRHHRHHRRHHRHHRRHHRRQQ